MMIPDKILERLAGPTSQSSPLESSCPRAATHYLTAIEYAAMDFSLPELFYSSYLDPEFLWIS